ncbi:MAG: hypothetical protein L6R35_006729, partial [Caloplaca aegaea]
MYHETNKKLSDESVKSGHELNADGAVERHIDNDPVYSYKEQRAIIHRVDRRLYRRVRFPTFRPDKSVMNLDLLMSGRWLSMTDDLNLGIEFRYSIIVLVFFPTYVIFQPPATVASRKFGPRIFLSTICLLWGATEIAFGFVKKWTDMLGIRVLLGVLEAGLYPSVVYLLATWYSRYDVGKRYCAFYVIGCLALAFGGILAYGLMQMEGLHGKDGWRWIFIMEGVFTCVAAFFAYFFLVDFPEKADRSWKFLSTEERDFILRRINKDRDDAIPEPFTIKRFLKPALDIKIWILALIS